MKKEIHQCQCKKCAVKSIPVFTLDEGELELLCSRSTGMEYRKGEKIFKQGTFTQNIVFISSGIFMIHQTGPIRRDEILLIDKGPRFLGIDDVFANKYHSYSATALSNASACQIDVHGFNHLLEQNNEFAIEIVKTLSYSLVDHYERCVNKVQKQLTAMLADSLLYFAEHLFEKDEFELPVNRVEWGQYIGTTRETITKILRDLSEDKIIAVDGKNITILNRKLLEKISMIRQD